MLKTTLLGVLATLGLASGAAAAPCPAYTYTLTNGQTADANQVMSNFTNILGCANNSLAPLANPHLTGNVGIGTNSPNATLHIIGTPFNPTVPAYAFNQIEIGNVSTTNWTAIGFAISNTDTGTGFGLIGENGDNLYMGHTNSTQTTALITAMANGNVGIGTTSPSYTLQVNGSAAGSQAWIVASDRRLKMNIEPMSNALDLVARLRGVQFQWRPPSEREVGTDLKLPQGTKQIGFIAQEVESVVPEAVVAPKAGSNGLYGLKEADLIPVLVEAIKEQQAQIGELRANLAALKSSIPTSR